MNDQVMANTARAIIKYHRNSFRTRIFESHIQHDVPLPICDEMDNLAKRLLGDYEPIDRFVQTQALTEIIATGTKELAKISEDAVKAERAALYLDRAREAYAEIKSAKEMLEML